MRQGQPNIVEKGHPLPRFRKSSQSSRIEEERLTSSYLFPLITLAMSRFRTCVDTSCVTRIFDMTSPHFTNTPGTHAYLRRSRLIPTVSRRPSGGLPPKIQDEVPV